MRKDRPSYGTLRKVTILFSASLVQLKLKLTDFPIASLRYSDRVKAETERLNQLELEELEVCFFYFQKLSYATFILCNSALYSADE